MAHPIENILKTTMEQLKEMVDVNTIVGNPMVTTNGAMVLPVSRVSLGFLSGGGEYGKGGAVRSANESTQACEGAHPFAGVTAAGMCLTPMAFLVVKDECVKLLPAHWNTTYDRMLDLIPQAVVDILKTLKKDESPAQ